MGASGRDRGPVCVVGSVNEDVLIRLDRHPGPGETVTALDVSRHAGGKGANQAVAAARAGAAVAMVGMVGADPAGIRMVAALRAAGVDVSAVGVAADRPTGTAYVMVDRPGESTIVVDRGANGALGPDRVRHHADRIQHAAVLLTQLEVPLEAVEEAVGVAAGAGVRVVLTAAPAQALPAAVTGAADPLILNAGEAAFYLGRPVGGDVGAAAGELLRAGPRSVVVTMGAGGAAVADRSGTRVIAARVVEVVDTTGAGDALAGALAGALAAGAGLDGAVEAGMAAAAEVIGRPGAR